MPFIGIRPYFYIPYNFSFHKDVWIFPPLWGHCSDFSHFWGNLAYTLLHAYFWKILNFLDLCNQNQSPDHDMWYFVLDFGLQSKAYETHQKIFCFRGGKTEFEFNIVKFLLNVRVIWLELLLDRVCSFKLLQMFQILSPSKKCRQTQK